jgi:hypothetical protein
MANIPILCKYLKQKKIGGCQYLIFGCSGVIDTAETDFGDFGSDYIGEYDAICKTKKSAIKLRKIFIRRELIVLLDIRL